MKLTRYVPLLASGIVLAMGCSTSLVPEAEKGFTGNPKVVAVYAVDNVAPNAYCTDTAGGWAFAFCGAPLPDVLVYAEPGSADAAKVSKVPPAYGQFRVEFDQPLDGSSIANNNDLSSFCTPATGSPVQLLDVADSNRVLGSSVCYDPSSALGQHPNVSVIIGKDVAFSGAAAAFSCNSFTNENTLDSSGKPVNNGLALKPETQYSIKLGSTIKGSNGNAATLPGNGAINVTTAGFDVMAVGYQDQSTGYFVWVDKPYKGFMKDLDAVAATDFRIPNDDTAVLIVTTMPVKESSTSASGRRMISGVAATRDDGSTFAPTFESEIVNAAAAANTSAGKRTQYAVDPRVIAVEPGWFWEPGTKYNITIQPALTASNGTTIAASAAKTYALQSTDGSFSKRLTGPGNNALAVGTRTDQLGLGAPNVYIVFSVPVDPSLADNTHVKLTGPEGDVPLEVAADDGSDNELVYALLPSGTAASALRPETQYKLSWTGLKTPPACTSPGTPANCVSANLAAKPITDGSISFTTATFRLADLQIPSGSSILRSASVKIDAVATGLVPVFTDKPTAGDITTANLAVYEGASTTPMAMSINPTGSTGRARLLQSTDTNYVLKFGQTYRVVASNAITSDPAATGTSVHVKAEGCTTPTAGNLNCSDVATFTTRKWVPAGFDFYNEGDFDPDHAVLDFYFSGSLPAIDPATTDLASHFHVYKMNADGTRGAEVAAGQLDCSLDTTEPGIDCLLPTGALAPNTTYMATVGWTKSAPLKPVGSVSGHTVDTDVNSPTGGAWFGTKSATTTTACP